MAGGERPVALAELGCALLENLADRFETRRNVTVHNGLPQVVSCQPRRVGR
jgi:hypothetical protein